MEIYSFLSKYKLIWSKKMSHEIMKINPNHQKFIEALIVTANGGGECGRVFTCVVGARVGGRHDRFPVVCGDSDLLRFAANC